jgi:hypothetical protein
VAIKFRKQSVTTLARRLDGEVVYIKTRWTTAVTIFLFLSMILAYFLYLSIKPANAIMGYASTSETLCSEGARDVCVVNLYTDLQTAQRFELGKNVTLSFLAPESLEQSIAFGEITTSHKTAGPGGRHDNPQNRGNKVWIASVAVRKEAAKLIFGRIESTLPQAVTILNTNSKVQPAGAPRNRL